MVVVVVVVVVVAICSKQACKCARGCVLRESGSAGGDVRRLGAPRASGPPLPLLRGLPLLVVLHQSGAQAHCNLVD